MKLVALGANLPSRFGEPRHTLYAALTAMAARNIWPSQVSRIWKTAPVPFDPGQDWYHNAVVEVRTDLPPLPLLQSLLDIEKEFGRVRGARNAARLLDLDLIAYDDHIVTDAQLTLPHPRLHERAFVLRPLHDIAEDWSHPVTGDPLDVLLGRIGADQQCQPIENGWEE